MKIIDDIVSGIKSRPEILIVVGVVGVVGSTIGACIATKKAKEIIEDTRESVDDISNDEEIDDKKKKSMIRKTYLVTGVKMVGVYAPYAVVGTLSVISIFTCNKIQRDRSLAMAAAYSSVDSMFKRYRENVVDELGEEADTRFRHGIKKVTDNYVEAAGTDADSVVPAEHKDNDYEVDPDMFSVIAEPSDYARFFDEASPFWVKDAEENLMFLKQQQVKANNMLRVRGFVLLNDVYKLLGIDSSRAGQIVGWAYNPEYESRGDNYIDFNIYNISDPAKRRFVNGYERNILLDFNVDGCLNGMTYYKDGKKRRY